MLELKYIEVSPNGNSYCSFPYYCTTNTSIVFKNLYVPLQPSITGGINIFTEGPGRFQATGNGLDGTAPKENDQYFRPVFGYYRSASVPQTIYYNMEWNTPNGIVGNLEMGNAYLKLNNTIVATGTTYTGDTITLTQPFYLFNHFNPNWRNNYLRSGYCGEVLFYENGVLAAKYTPYLDNNGVAGFFDENNQTMIYSMGNPWVAGPPASSILISPENRSIAADGGSIVVNVTSENDWVANPTDGSWYSISPTGGTSADTAVTITVPSYTGTTARQDTISFVDTTTTDEAVFTLKQRKYTDGTPFYLGGAEVTEAFLGGDSVSEAYLGEDLVFSA